MLFIGELLTTDPVKSRVALLAPIRQTTQSTTFISIYRTWLRPVRHSLRKNQMNKFQTYRREWFSNIRGDLLSGIVVALALIPEAIGFSVIAGVDPKVGLFASFAIACVSAFTAADRA